MKASSDFEERRALMQAIKNILKNEGYGDTPCKDGDALHYDKCGPKGVRLYTAQISVLNDSLPTKDTFVAIIAHHGCCRASCVRHERAEDFVNIYSQPKKPVVKKAFPNVRKITNG